MTDDIDTPSTGGTDRSPEEKLRLVLDALALDDEDLGAFLRREGIHEAQMREWMQTALGALGGAASGASSPKDKKRIRMLERELRRKDSALAEATALLVLRGKLASLLEEEGDDTTGR